MTKILASVLALAGFGIALANPVVKIVGIQAGGTGCPAGSVAGIISPDADTFTLIFDQFVAQQGPGMRPTEGRKFCQVNVSMDFPQGWSYSLFDATYRGYASLDRGITGTQKSTYYFGGYSAQKVFQTVLRGPFDGNYERTDTLGMGATVWSPCGARATLNIKADVQLAPYRGTNPGSMMTVDSVDAKVQQIYGLQWQRCPGY